MAGLDLGKRYALDTPPVAGRGAPERRIAVRLLAGEMCQTSPEALVSPREDDARSALRGQRGEGQIPHPAANALVHPPYRQGWPSI